MTLRGRRRSAGARISGPGFLAREVALLEEHILPRRRDPRVFLLVEDDLGLRRRARTLIPVRSRAAAGVAARTATAGAGAGSAWFVTTLLSISIEGVRVRVLLRIFHIVLS